EPSAGDPGEGRLHGLSLEPREGHGVLRLRPGAPRGGARYGRAPLPARAGGGEAMSLTGIYHVDPSDLGVTAAEMQERFDKLQGKLVPLWKSIQTMSQDPQ